ncbi:MAG: general secretion pathway protein GspM [Methylomarinum sp.]|nr:general secretion pathway protein GspM [Methylomarinum sp.]
MNEVSNQRWLALGLLGLVLILVLFIVIVPVVSMGLEYHEQKQELFFRLQRARKIVARKDSVKENNADIKKQFQLQNYFSTRDTEALASADLQKIIKSAISQAGGQLTSTQVLPHSMENGFNQVTVKVRMSGDIEMLRSVLYEIESSAQIMIINQLDIRPVRGKRNRKTRKIEPSNKMNINFQVAGFMRNNDE